ncbi:PREDICTED: uncharacterized protein LOC105366651 [Ceratosolen solmsi marchali]|uniref:Uncharacterized protein LOC105366651 n=1 Tax=Ceratosolen solmsi marchali TaxID=326594 RepID=A0AAJ6YSM3_9HYME|nr:PREDICTED: uncharacterized protein LOC105366651 [Ceratosolen solmsi marchali]
MPFDKERIITELLQEIVDEWNKIVIPNKCKTIAYYCDLFCKMDLYIESFLTSYYPFDYQQSPYFEIIYTMHLIQSVALIATDSLSKTLLIVYNNSGNYHNLKMVIVEHVKISTLVKKIDNCYTYVSLLQIGINNIIIAISAFTILTLMKLITFTMIILSQTVTFCLIGDFLESEGNSIANALYNGVWYNVKPTEIKVIAFIIEYSQNPLLLTGGKFFKISISSCLRSSRCKN